MWHQRGSSVTPALTPAPVSGDIAWRYGDMAILREGGGSASHQTGDRRCGFVDLVLCLWSASMHGVGDAMSEVIVQ